MKKEDAYRYGVAQTEFRKKFKREQQAKKVRGIIGWVVSLILIFIAMFIVCFSITVCKDSAANGIEPGDIVVSNRFAYLVNQPQRGDLVTFMTRNESGSLKTVQRRIIGLPGENIRIEDHKLYINDMECVDPYELGELDGKIQNLTVPQGSYYVLSDNREEGPDSRDLIYVKPDSIIGSVILTAKTPEWAAASGIIEFLDNLNRRIG